MTTRSTQTFIEAMERRYGSIEAVGRGNVLQFGSHTLFAISSSKLLSKSYFYAIQEDFLQLAFRRPLEEIVKVYAVLICGDDRTVLVLPHALIASLVTNPSKNRVHIYPRNDGYYLKTSGHPAIDVTQYLNAYPLQELAQETKEETLEVADVIESAEQQEEEINEHTRIQWMLIRFGKAAGHNVWVPANDRGKSFANEPFTHLTLSDLPNFGFEPVARRIISNIDVLWLEENVIHQAFEIESTTSVYSGLLRMSDLVMSQPNVNIDLSIVAPARRREIVRRNIMRPTFSRLRPKCSYISFDEVTTKYDMVKDILKKPTARIVDLLDGESFQ